MEYRKSILNIHHCINFKIDFLRSKCDIRFFCKSHLLYRADILDLINAMQKNGFVYIITDQVGWKLSVWVTTDLSKRLHRLCTVSKQSTRSKNETPRLVYVERRQHVLDALIRKQTLTKWPRAKKLELINQFNPVWRDLRRTRKRVV